MTYRDEKEALRAENQALKDELASLKGQQSPPVRDRNANAGGAFAAGVAAVVVGGLAVGVGLFTALRTPGRIRRAPAAPIERVTAVWSATVQSAEGESVAVGVPCVINARVETSGTRGELPARVAVICGGRLLYSVDEAHVNGGSMISSGEARVVSRVGSRRTFAISFDERGTELRAYPRLALDSSAGTALIVREGQHPMRVQLRVVRESEPVTAAVR